MILFTADQHLGHTNIIKLCGRPFADVWEMDEALINNCNPRVTNGDTVYIIGNHDNGWQKSAMANEKTIRISSTQVSISMALARCRLTN